MSSVPRYVRQQGSDTEERRYLDRPETLEELELKWGDYVQRVRARRFDSMLANLQLNMAEEFVADLEHLTGRKPCGICPSRRKGGSGESRKVCPHSDQNVWAAALLLARGFGVRVFVLHRRREMAGQLTLLP